MFLIVFQLAIAAQSLRSKGYKLMASFVMAITYFGRWSDYRIVRVSGSSHKSISPSNGKNALEETCESTSSALIPGTKLSTTRKTIWI
jgi:hypothetical protein